MEYRHPPLHHCKGGIQIIEHWHFLGAEGEQLREPVKNPHVQTLN
jgi:hypothetical protein